MPEDNLEGLVTPASVAQYCREFVNTYIATGLHFLNENFPEFQATEEEVRETYVNLIEAVASDDSEFTTQLRISTQAVVINDFGKDFTISHLCNDDWAEEFYKGLTVVASEEVQKLVNLQ